MYEELDRIIKIDMMNNYGISAVGADQFLQAKMVTDEDDRKALRDAVRHTFEGPLRPRGFHGKGH